MVNNDYTHLSFVLDRSGSMSVIRDDTIGGFNSFLEKQKEVEGKVTVSMIQFDHEYETLYTGAELGAVKPLDTTTFVPRGSTALLDAVGRMVNETGAFLSTMKEEDRPGKVLFIIVTDGEENSSREFTLKKIKKMVTLQTDTYSWEFVFLGANIDAINVAGGFGIAASNAIKYGHNSGGTSAAYDSLCTNVAQMRKGVTKSAAFTQADRDIQEQFLEEELEEDSDSQTS